MANSDSESISLWVMLSRGAGLILFFWAVWTGYNYFKPPVIPPPIPGQYADTIQWMSIQDGEAEFQKGQKCILYDFTAEWCHYCHILESEVFSVPPVAQFINQYFIPIRVMDRAQEDGKNSPAVADLQRQYGISGFPTLVVRYPNDVSKKMVGYANADYTVQFLKDAVSPK
jgi:thiol:disulfide interchange protein